MYTIAEKRVSLLIFIAMRDSFRNIEDLVYAVYSRSCFGMWLFSPHPLWVHAPVCLQVDKSSYNNVYFFDNQSQTRGGGNHLPQPMHVYFVSLLNGVLYSWNKSTSFSCRASQYEGVLFASSACVAIHPFTGQFQ